MIRLSLERRQQEFELWIDPELHSQVIGDARRIKQVLVNILENASKYTNRGKKITFSLEELKKQEQQAGTYRFTIEDAGVGMTPEYLQHIFEPFTRLFTIVIPSPVPGTLLIRLSSALLNGSKIC